MAKSCRYCYEEFEDYQPNAAKKHLRPITVEPLRELHLVLQELSEWTAHRIDDVIQKVADQFEWKLGKIGQPVRVAVTGGPVSPPLGVTLEIVGRQRSLERLERAVRHIEARIE